jgi:hypothetical protein
MYYCLEDAREILTTFTSWIGKRASVGDGTTDILKSIEVKESTRIARTLAPEKRFSVNFKFENKKRFTAQEFLKANGLEHTIINRQPVSYRAAITCVEVMPLDNRNSSSTMLKGNALNNQN